MTLSKALLILPDYPFPVDNGYRIKSNNFIHSLKDRYDLTVVTITYKNSSPYQLENFKIECPNVKYLIFKISFFEVFINFLKAIILNEPTQKHLFVSSKFLAFVEAYKFDFSYVFFSTVRTGFYANLFLKSTIVFDFIDSIGLNYLSSKNNTTSLLKKLYYNYEANKLFKYELECASMSRISLFVNYLEANIFSKKSQNIHYIPNGVKPELFIYKDLDSSFSNCFTFLGTMSYQPNVDAVAWFTKNVLCLIDKNYKFYVIGNNPPKSLLRLTIQNEQIKFTGFIRDPYLLINSSFCFVAPMQNGAGIQNKVIEAMALGKIVILSSKAAKPFRECIDKVHFIISDDPINIASNIKDIFLNPNKYSYMSKNAKSIILNNYTWDSYNVKLYKLLDSIV